MKNAEKNIQSSWAAWLVRAWTNMYTVGLSVSDRDEQISEIDSDLWELGFQATDHDVMSRLIHGIPQDLIWRVQMIGNGEERGHGRQPSLE